MKSKKRNTLITLFALFIVAAFFISGCGATNGTANTNAITAKSGVQLWGDNCSSCHNTRSLQSLTDAQWEVAGTHMRLRANLTAVESNKIIKFLKQAN